MVGELKALIDGITFDCTFETLQMTNVFTLKGSLPARRQTFLESIGRYQAMKPIERAHFLFNRYFHGGYLDFIRSWGRDDSSLKGRFERQRKALKGKPPMSWRRWKGRSSRSNLKEFLKGSSLTPFSST
jgi:hypothetical protein